MRWSAGRLVDCDERSEGLLRERWHQAGPGYLDALLVYEERLGISLAAAPPCRRRDPASEVLVDPVAGAAPLAIWPPGCLQAPSGSRDPQCREVGTRRTRGLQYLRHLPIRVRSVPFRLLTGLHARRSHRTNGLSWRSLPRSVRNPGLDTPAVWEPGDPLRVPRGVLVHHANYAIGVDNKLAQLEAVERIVRGRSQPTSPINRRA